MSFPLVHVTCGYSPEVQPFQEARRPVLHLHCGHPQQQLVHALGDRLFIPAKLCGIYLAPQNTVLIVFESVENGEVTVSETISKNY